MSESNYQLIVRKGPNVGQTFYLDARSSIIGRDPMSDFVLNDPEVSRQHARLTRLDDGFQVEDLGSTNGTFVDGERLANDAYLLLPDQVITMGSGIKLIYQLVEAAAVMSTSLSEESPVWEEQARDTPEQMREDAFADPELDNPESAYEYSAPDTFTSLEVPTASLSPTSEGDNGDSRKQRNLVIALIGILLLCCCCSFVAFMYQWGGDMLLEYFGLLP
ncbi:MAG: FHA domain-containing protein [Chloroflexi bacterium]|nr:FHA domain-containing protein [Chloroflexota bacterium]